MLKRIDLGRSCFATVLGGPDRRTLFMLTADWRGTEGVEDVILYGADEAVEEYYCTYGLSPQYGSLIERTGLRVTGVDDDGEVRIVELDDDASSWRRCSASRRAPDRASRIGSSPGLPHPREKRRQSRHCRRRLLDERSRKTRLMALGYVLVESMRPGTRLEGLPLTLKKIERHPVRNATPDQPSVWTTVEFDFPEEEAGRLADALAGVLDEHGGRAHAPSVTLGKRERMRSPSADADHVDDLKAKIVEKLRRVVGNDRDAATRQPSRCAKARSVEHDYARVEPVVGVLVRMARVARARGSLKPKDGPAVGRAVLAPSVRPSRRVMRPSLTARS